MGEDNILELFSNVSLILHRLQYHGRKENGAFQLSHRGQGRILSILKMQPEISQKDLSYLLDMSNQSLSELLGKLEKSGFIIKAKSETDRRVMNIKLTEAGAEAADRAAEQKHDGEEFFNCLTAAEKDSFIHCMKKIISANEAELSSRPDFGDGWNRERNQGGITPEMMVMLHGDKMIEKHGNDKDGIRKGPKEHN